MKKLIKQDMIILLALIASYHPEAVNEIKDGARKLTMQDTREYLLLIRDGRCVICPYSEAFRPGGEANAFWLNAPGDISSVWALHLYLTRVARGSPEGSAVVIDYDDMRGTIEKAMGMDEIDRRAVVSQTIHYCLTHTQLFSTLDFIRLLKGGDG